MEQSNFNFEGLSEEDIRSAKASEYNVYLNSQNQMDCGLGLNFDIDKSMQGDVGLKEKIDDDERINKLHNTWKKMICGTFFGLWKMNLDDDLCGTYFSHVTI